ncbi:unnamed protein product [Fusarium venenatum]|uniref:Uncharacterized protein n=1 Tax=Fusarium venenatum TaxID=56646 RepID=A0A2L2T5W9_9HYPO|nr:uncharacterized protein FVRRES_01561 [Fusarium venenatum]CEI65049.1 unnamed protein product [Fusarium venenatum]
MAISVSGSSLGIPVIAIINCTTFLEMMAGSSYIRYKLVSFGPGIMPLLNPGNPTTINGTATMLKILHIGIDPFHVSDHDFPWDPASQASGVNAHMMQLILLVSRTPRLPEIHELTWLLSYHTVPSEVEPQPIQRYKTHVAGNTW